MANAQNQTPLIAWGFYSTPKGRAGLASVAELNNPDIINIFDWSKYSPAINASQDVNNLASLYHLGVQNTPNGQFLMIRQLQFAYEHEGTRNGYLSSFIVGKNAYFKPEQTAKLFENLEFLCREQRSKYTNGLQFNLGFRDFQNIELPQLNLDLREVCSPSNTESSFNPVKPRLFIKAESKNELIALVDAILRSQIFKDFEGFYFSTDHRIMENLYKLFENERIYTVPELVSFARNVGNYRNEILSLQQGNIERDNKLQNQQNLFNEEYKKLVAQHQNEKAQIQNEHATVVQQYNQRIESINAQHALEKSQLQTKHVENLKQLESAKIRVEAQRDELIKFNSRKVVEVAKKLTEDEKRRLLQLAPEIKNRYSQRIANLGTQTINKIVTQERLEQQYERTYVPSFVKKYWLHLLFLCIGFLLGGVSTYHYGHNQGKLSVKPRIYIIALDKTRNLTLPSNTELNLDIFVYGFSPSLVEQEHSNATEKSSTEKTPAESTPAESVPVQEEKPQTPTQEDNVVKDPKQEGSKTQEPKPVVPKADNNSSETK